MTAHSVHPQLYGHLVASLEQASARYGSEFETAFRTLLFELEERKAHGDLGLWRGVTTSQDPGEAIFQWYRLNWPEEEAHAQSLQ